MSNVTSRIAAPLAALVVLIICMAFAGLVLAAGLSGALTNAAIAAGGFVAIILILFMIRTVGG